MDKCQLAIYNWQLSIVNWQLIIYTWQLTIDNCQLSIANWRLTIVNWQFSSKQVEIIDSPVREINGLKGIVRSFDVNQGRYKVEVQKDPKKAPQDFLMKKEMLKINV